MNERLMNAPMLEMQTMNRELKRTPQGTYTRYETTYDPPQTLSANDLMSLPRSVREHLEAAVQPTVPTSVAPDQLQEVAAMFRAAGVELARSHPELFTMIMLGSMGYEGISFKESEQVPRYQGLGKLMAAVTGGDPSEMVTVRETTRTIRLLK